MRFKDIDLNLLVVLDHLMTERSVSRAADKLMRNQSTVSGLLGKLRDHFNDDLLVQVGREMVPTARGLELADAVRDVLLQIEARVLTAPEFDPTRSDRQIRLFASDYLMIAGLAEAMRRIIALAPNLTFVVLQPGQFLRGRDTPASLLEKGEVDLLAIPKDYMSDAHPTLTLFAETFCCLLCRDNPEVGDRLTLNDFMRLRHVTVGFGPGSAPSYEDWFQRAYGPSARTIDIVAGSFTTLPFLLPGTRRIALCHRRLAEAYTRFLPLRIVETPFEIPPLVEGIQWHHYTGTDRALMWVRDQIVLAMQQDQPVRV